MTKKIKTRFAPSPTGYLHTGSARTALFNYLYSKNTGGEFLLRIEDTDKERSTDEATQQILNDMKWLGIDWDGEPIYQSKRDVRHREVALELLEKGLAYKCFATQEQIEKFREENPHAKFQSPWRDLEPLERGNYAVRLRAPKEGTTVVHDEVMGEISVENKELDDMILLRSDGTPTYMLAVVVDDADMGITHIIRGDDHLTNTFRQYQLYKAMGWEVPNFAHIPLILDQEGKKLSKRKGALGMFEYREQGYLPEAVCNHLLRLGFSNGDDEIIPMDRAKEIFNLGGIGKSPSRFDIDKLKFVNKHYMQLRNPNDLLELAKPFNKKLDDEVIAARFLKACHLLVERCSTVTELAQISDMLVNKVPLDEKSISVMNDFGGYTLPKLKELLSNHDDWTKDSLKSKCNDFAEGEGIKMSYIMQSLRAGVIGTFNSPGVFDMLEILGKDDVLKRMES